MAKETKTLDIKSLSDSELKLELKKRKSAKSDERKAYKSLVQEELPNSIEILKFVSQKLAQAKTEVFEKLAILVDLKTKVYGVKSSQQSHTFSLNNGDTVTMGYRVTDNYDDTIGEGIAKVTQFINSLAKDEATSKLVKTINQLLKKDAKDNLKPSRVIELYKLTEDFNSDLFTDGVDILMKAYKPIKSVYFIDATVIGKSGAKENVPLSISSVSFTKEIEIKF